MSEVKNVREAGILVERRRKDSLRIDNTEIANRVIKLWDDGVSNRAEERDLRIQRYAKLRSWTEGKDWPWENASDAGVTDMMTHSLRVQDDLHNAIMSGRPVVTSKATKDEFADKQETIDSLQDYQVFEEQDGEEFVGTLIRDFVEDGTYIAFVPWIKEKREIVDARQYPAIPEGVVPQQYFQTILADRAFPNSQAAVKASGEGWDWTVFPENEDNIDVRFWTLEDGRIEMAAERVVTVFDGPRPMAVGLDDIVFPTRAANLLTPSPKNPNGASYVILRFVTTVDEVRRLVKSGHYDLLDEEQKNMLGLSTKDDTSAGEEKEQLDALQGTNNDPLRGPEFEPHHELTLLMCFDIHDLDGDGIAEDVVFWVIKEIGAVARARRLTEAFHSPDARRPLFDKSFLPNRNRVIGISLLEQMEPLHDLLKQIIDQTIDNGTISTVPFGFYRPVGSMKPEVIKFGPGDMYPLNDPQRDVNFPTMNNNASAFGLNMMSILNTFEERLTMFGDLQFGRVPAGRASALRTNQNMALVSAEGEARPERVLRRFFSGLTEIWKWIHGLNSVHLPKNKQVRIVGVKSANADPYLTIADTAQIEGSFDFTFHANVFNASRLALQQALNGIAQTYISELSLSLGIIDEVGVYKLQRDIGRAAGIDPDRYLKEPSPGSMKERLMAEEVLSLILAHQIPEGVPMEPPQEHLQKIQKVVLSDDFGRFDAESLVLLQGWTQTVLEFQQQQEQQQQILQAAQRFQQGGQPGAQQVQSPDLSQPQISGDNELLDESLPAAGGGANA